MNGTPDEIELHPAVGECLTRLRADLAASEARCDYLRASVREYLAAEASVAYALADDSDACDAAAMLARMHTARTRRDEALARLRATRDATAQGFDDLVVRVWRAATGDTHEGPASADALLDAVAGLRADNARLDDVAKGALDDLAKVRAELDYLDALLARQAAILTGVANALRGPPGPLASHSHHDLAERAEEMKRELDEARAALLRGDRG